MTRRGHFKGFLAATAIVLTAASLVIARDTTSPDEWLQRMANAIDTLDYEGTVIRRQNGEAQPLKVVHKKINGVVNERIVSQEGNGLEVIRIGNEVHCILPDKKSVLIEHWDSASTLFSTIPSSKINPGAQYDVLIMGLDERVAGRSAVKLAIKPNDVYRFEHRFWIDKETGFPLRSDLIGISGEVVDQLKFADISIGQNITEKSLAPSVSLENFAWYSSSANANHKAIESDWIGDGLPAGFSIISAQDTVLASSNLPVTHLVVGDGMASVSVFISASVGNEIERSAHRGASSSYSTEISGFRITAVGEVPAETVEIIATAMRRK